MDKKAKEMKFCRLCGKNRKADEFKEIKLARNTDGQAIQLEACESCQTVFHNVRLLITEAMKVVSQARNIIVPGSTPSGLIIKPR